LIFALSFFEGGKLRKQAGCFDFFGFQGPNGRLVNGARQCRIVRFKLGKLGKFDVRRGRGIIRNVALQNDRGGCRIAVSQFKSRIGKPGRVVRMPLHPPFKDSAAFGHVSGNFFDPVDQCTWKRNRQTSSLLVALTVFVRRCFDGETVDTFPPYIVTRVGIEKPTATISSPNLCTER
jgi:hypothetical protein